jgi:hypothetical protein
LIPIGSDHGPAELVEPSPGRLVAPKPHGPLAPERVGPVLLAGHLPGNEEPLAQLPCALEDRAGGGGDLASTGRAHTEASARAPSRSGHMTLRADEALCPPQPLQVRRARLLVGEELAELEERAGIVNASSGLGTQRIDHGHSL